MMCSPEENRFDAAPVLADLKRFQRRTVDHVFDAFHRRHRDRFLVADETGLGKSIVARGLIAKTVEHLQDTAVDRIDIVYVCSNADLARQNLTRLTVTGQDIPLNSRLTLLALELASFESGPTYGGKQVNFVSFTPGTSFDTTQNWDGRSEERALLHIILSDLLNLDGPQRRASAMFLRGNRVKTAQSFAATIANMRVRLAGPVDTRIADGFAARAEEQGLLDQFRSVLTRLSRKQKLPDDVRAEQPGLVGAMRSALAFAGVDVLTPDLVILDEFQRFRQLLDAVDRQTDDPTTEDEPNSAATLARYLFGYHHAKVLLLSATPYKAYTGPEEFDDNHASDFLRVLSFLFGGDELEVSRVATALSKYRQQIIAAGDAAAEAADIRELLLRVMCRTERPQTANDIMLTDADARTDPPTPADLSGYRALARVSDMAHSRSALEYWKSIPYFAHFMDNYELGGFIRHGLATGDPAVIRAVRKLRKINAQAVHGYERIDFGNGKLRALADHTLTGSAKSGASWASLLWVPPSLPYLEPGGPYARVDEPVTKQLVFSQWQATPTALASLLSYEAERAAMSGQTNTTESRDALRSRFQYRASADRGPQSMTTLMLFWPVPQLATAADPLAAAQHRGTPIPTRNAEAYADEQIADIAEPSRAHACEASMPDAAASSAPKRERPSWQAYFSWPGPPELDLDMITDTVRAGNVPDHESAAFRTHAEFAQQLHADEGKFQHPWLTQLAMHAPGNIAYRALRRVITDQDQVSTAQLWLASRRVATGLRSLFSRPETATMLDQSSSGRQPYWQRVLAYCAAGNLQAVLDEHVFNLRSQRGSAPMDDAALQKMAETITQALTLPPSRLTAKDPATIENSEGSSDLGFRGRFARRYSAMKQSADSARPAEVQQAFNSPFWPFVLVTTSAGQEGIDFHWWSHSVWHWNVPANPVDLEQREGRVHRYMGHAIRKNVADQHQAVGLQPGVRNPWAAMFDAAVSEDDDDEFVPYWVYPGHHKIQRHLIDYPLSRETDRTRRILTKLALYRMTLGQPRQDDLVKFLQDDAARTEGLELNLRP